jgi:hypothetical protein
MSRLERWIIYPVLAVLALAVLGRELALPLRSASAEDEGTKETVVTAQYFRLVDAAGRERASLRVPNSPAAAAGLNFFDDSGDTAAGIAVGGDGVPMLWVGGIGMQVTSKGENTLQINDKDGKTRVLLGVTGEQSAPAGLSLFDGDERQRIRVVIGPTGSPEVKIFDKDDKPIWESPTR